MKNKKDLIRHGDLLFRPAEYPDTLERGRTLIERDSRVILEGEVTGHAHRFVAGDAAILDYYEETWRGKALAGTYVNVTTPATVTHEEHGPLSVMPGFYEIIRAREFDYASRLSRRVVD